MIKLPAKHYGYRYSYEPTDNFNTATRRNTPSRAEMEKLIGKMTRVSERERK